MKLGLLACLIALPLPVAADDAFVDVAKLEGQFVFTKGKLSLAIKPNGDGAVYLVNDTDKPIEGAILELTDCVPEAKIGGVWKRCHPLEIGCGTVGGSSPLPPRKAYPLASVSATKGDQEAEMRYSVFQGAFVSSSFRGRYSSRDRAVAAAQEAILENDWEKFPYSRTPEELIALLELERHCENFQIGPDFLKGLAEKIPFPLNDKARFESSATKLLARPRPKNLGDAAFFERCVTALSTPPSEKHGYGSPEHCRVMVWRRLCAPPGASSFIKEKPEIKPGAVPASGNPWGVEEKWLMALMELTVKAVSSGDAFEKHEAGAFLGMPWIREENFPKGSIAKLLESNAPEVQKAAAAIRERAKKANPKP